MKDKKAKDNMLRKQHLDILKTQRRKQPLLDRPNPFKFEKPTILIVCEGKNTEPSYFRQFKLSSATIKSVGEGYNTVSLVERAKQIASDSQKKNKKYDKVWCVFDADPKPDNLKQSTNFNEAIRLAIKNGFGVAYSNQAFEYWIILHFVDHQGGQMNRVNYNTKINNLLKPYSLNYEGNGSKIITEDLFDLMAGTDEKTGKARTLLAITRAKKIYKSFDHKNPANEESSTTVYRLVEELLKYV